jgi:hypothetical protein
MDSLRQDRNDISEHDQRARIVLPYIVDKLASEEPSSTWLHIPIGSDLRQGWRSLTYGDLHAMVSGAMRWAQERAGYREGDVVAYIGLNDIRYAVFVVALMKLGLKVRQNKVATGSCSSLTMPASSDLAQKHSRRSSFSIREDGMQTRLVYRRHGRAHRQYSSA